MHYRVGQKLVLIMSQLFFKEQSEFLLLPQRLRAELQWPLDRRHQQVGEMCPNGPGSTGMACLVHLALLQWGSASNRWLLQIGYPIRRKRFICVTHILSCAILHFLYELKFALNKKTDILFIVLNESLFIAYTL